MKSIFFRPNFISVEIFGYFPFFFIAFFGGFFIIFFWKWFIQKYIKIWISKAKKLSLKKINMFINKNDLFNSQKTENNIFQKLCDIYK